MSRMSDLRDMLAHAVMGAVGIVLGILSAVALALAAIVPALLGLLAFMLSPLRAIVQRVLRSGKA